MTDVLIALTTLSVCLCAWNIHMMDRRLEELEDAFIQLARRMRKDGER